MLGTVIAIIKSTFVPVDRLENEVEEPSSASSLTSSKVSLLIVVSGGVDTTSE